MHVCLRGEHKLRSSQVCSHHLLQLQSCFWGQPRHRTTGARAKWGVKPWGSGSHREVCEGRPSTPYSWRSQCSGDRGGSHIREENKLIVLPPDCLAEVNPLLIASRTTAWTSSLLLALLSTRQEPFIVSDLRIQNGKSNWFPETWEIQSNSPSTQHQLCIHHSKDIARRANSCGVTCPNNYMFPLDSSGATHSRKISSTFVASKKKLRSWTSWTEIRLPAEGTKPHSLPSS